MVQRPEDVIEPRTIVPPVVLHPTSNLWIEHPRQILNRLVTPTLKLPSTHLLADAFVSYTLRATGHENTLAFELIAKNDKRIAVGHILPQEIVIREMFEPSGRAG
jgi:hypothetical protein